NFLQLLADNKRLNVLPDIDVLFKEFLAEEQRIEYVSVVSAAPLSQAIKRDLEEKLKARFKSEVNVEYSEDKALIGGAIVRTNRWVMDGSIRGKLAKIRDSLIAS
ncbi:MAG TPA: ATP synthase F1 subunit delta, partial [Coxiellaceae bacterium]|nr:ATP synthase F1 subunit delta [Coxiellaceae bacterium]